MQTSTNKHQQIFLILLSEINKTDSPHYHDIIVLLLQKIMDPEFYLNILSIPERDLHNAIQGGLIIALASSIYYFLFGGILGMSGMAGSIIKFPTRQSTKAKAIVILGIITASAILNALFQFQKIKQLPFDNIELTLATPITKLIIAGALVGVGTELSNGCTSGHGLCGLPRLSLRSFTAVIVFLLTAIYTATFDLADNIPDVPQLQLQALEGIEINPTVYIGACLFIVVVLTVMDKSHNLLAKFALYCVGIVFGCGLMIAGMTYRSKIYGFLQLDKNWDPSLLFVLMTGVTLNLITFTIIRKFIHKPTYGQKIEDPHGKITVKLILGSLLFGLGWGLGGLCPGPYLLSIPNSLKIAFYWGVPFFLGQKITNLISGQGHHHQHHVSVAKKNK